MAQTAGCGRIILVSDGGEIALDGATIWKIGRSDHCEVVVADSRVSREHAAIQRLDGEYYLIDLGSRNGSFVNDARVSTPVHLRDRDRLSIGGYPILFRYEGASERVVFGGPADNLDATVAWFTQQLLTVLVVDVRNFTELTHRLDQAILCQVIGTWFRVASDVMRRHGCWSLKFIGDAVMAVWLHQEGASRASEILEVLAGVVEFARATSELEGAFALPQALRIGSGINTGLASVGNTGTGSVVDYTAMGDTVNAAFRIESATKEIGADVALGNSTWEALRACGDPDRYFDAHAVTLKGYAEPTTIWAASLARVAAYLNR